MLMTASHPTESVKEFGIANTTAKFCGGALKGLHTVADQNRYSGRHCSVYTIYLYPKHITSALDSRHP